MSTKITLAAGLAIILLGAVSGVICAQDRHRPGATGAEQSPAPVAPPRDPELDQPPAQVKQDPPEDSPDPHLEKSGPGQETEPENPDPKESKKGRAAETEQKIAAVKVIAGLAVGWFIAVVIGGLILYFIPTVIGLARKHPNSTGIFLINFFFGWSLLGWIAALVWAVSSTSNREVIVIHQHQK